MSPPPDPKAQNLKNSFRDGLFAASMSGFTLEFFAPFLILLGAPLKHMAWLNAIPNLFAALIQIRVPELMEKLRFRKKTILIFVFLQALCLLPMPFVQHLGFFKEVAFILLVTLFTGCGALAAPAWGSLMSDIIPEKERGDYFGWRTSVLGFVTVGMAFVAGAILYFLKPVNPFLGFGLIFLLASVFRFVSFGYLRKMEEPAWNLKREDSFTFYQFIARARESNFVKFVLFVSFLSFSVNLAAPYFAVLMLRELHFDYLTYTTVSLTATLAINFLCARWGRHADAVGNRKILRLTSRIISILPMLWLIDQSTWFLIFAQIVSGFAWAGFNLCASNYIFDAISPSKRARCIAYFNVLNGLALCAGSFLGGWLVTHLPPIHGSSIFTLFVVSTVCRVFAATTIAWVKEVRPVEPVRSNDLFFSMVGVKPILGVERKTVRYS